MIVAVSSPKGGVGKTLLSVHLLAAMSRNKKRRTVLVDCDPNRSSLSWVSSVAPDARVESASDCEELLAVADGLDAHTDAVLDLAGSDTDLHRGAALACDVMVVPTGSGLLDLRCVGTALKMAAQAQKIRRGTLPVVRVVLNRAAMHQRATQEALHALREMNAPLVEATLGQRQAFAQCVSNGCTVDELPNAGEAAEEMRRVIDAILKN